MSDETELSELETEHSYRLPAPTGTSMGRPWLLLEDASRLLGVCRTTLRRRIKAGKIASVKVGNALAIPALEVERLIRDTLDGVPL